MKHFSLKYNIQTEICNTRLNSQFDRTWDRNVYSLVSLVWYLWICISSRDLPKNSSPQELQECIILGFGVRLLTLLWGVETGSSSSFSCLSDDILCLVKLFVVMSPSPDADGSSSRSDCWFCFVSAALGLTTEMLSNFPAGFTYLLLFFELLPCLLAK